MKREENKSFLRHVESLLEIVILTVLYCFTWGWGYHNGDSFPAHFLNNTLLQAGVYAGITFFVFYNSDCFRFGQLRMIEIVTGQIIAALIVNAITYIQLCVMTNKFVSLLPIIVLVVVDVLVAVLLTVLFTAIYHRLYKPHEMLLIYGGQNAVGLKRKIDARRDKYHVKSMISIDEGFDKICDEIKKYDAIILNDIPAQIRNDILKFCYEKGERSYVVPKLTDIILREARSNTLFDTPMLLVKGLGLSLAQRSVKRAMDIFLCLIAMIVAAPIMLIVAAAIKLEDGGPVFYKQERVTINGKKFDILKFRSMIVDAEKEGKSIPATDHDPRITKVGRITRATRIDELPQLLNILKGDMSIVGPRPERVEHVEKYSAEIPEFSYRLKVKGGLTGFAQIYGKYNTSAYDKLRLDLMYIEQYSLLLDIKLIILTVKIMLSKESTEGFDKQVNQENKAADINTQQSV